MSRCAQPPALLLKIARSRLPLHLCLLVVQAACGSPTSPSALSTSGGPTGSGPSGAPLVIAVGGEPRTLISSVGGSPTSASDHLFDLVHASLVSFDDQARPIPMAARELPSLDKGTWRVNPDGSMETVWQLRDNARWHDGRPLTAADVVFSWHVFSDQAVPVASRRVARLIASIESPDPQTVIIRWGSRYGYADHLTAADLTLLPSHLLEATYELRRDQFAGHAYWRNQFVGLGPYHVKRWPAGSSIELAAFGDYFLGPPRVAEISVRFISDDSAAMAAVLSGTVDVLLPRRAAQGVVRTVRERWASSGEGTLSILPGHSWIFLAPQFRSPQPEELADPRIRQALVHTLDRRAIAEALGGDPSLSSDLWIPASDPRYSLIAEGMTRYGFDLARARELFREVGWRREGADDVLLKHGRRLEIEVTTVASLERSAAVVADSWRDGGIAAREMVFSLGGITDRQARAAYSGVELTAGVPNLPLVDSRLHSANAPSAENQWVGVNRGRYASAEFDDLVDRLWVTLDRPGRDAVERALARHVAAELPLVPLLFYPSMAMARAHLQNVRPPTTVAPVGRPSYGWNAHEWEKR